MSNKKVKNLLREKIAESIKEAVKVVDGVASEKLKKTVLNAAKDLSVKFAKKIKEIEKAEGKKLKKVAKKEKKTTKAKLKAEKRVNDPKSLAISKKVAGAPVAKAVTAKTTAPARTRARKIVKPAVVSNNQEVDSKSE